MNVRAWIWFARRYGVQDAFFYWMQGRRQGWMTHEEFVDFINDKYPEANKEMNR